MALLTSRHTASTLALILAGLLIVPAAHAGPLAAAKADTQSAVVHVDHDWDDDDDYYYSRRHYRRYYRSGYYDRPYYGYGYGYGYRRYRNVDVDAPFASVRVRPRGVYVRAPFVRLYVPRY